MARPLNVLIAGGGIGGLAAAIACLMVGLRVTVFDKAETFQSVGAGLQVSANGLRALGSLGVGDLQAYGTEIDHVLVHDGLTGHHLTSIPTPRNPKSITISRADLHAALWGRLIQIHGSALEMGAAVETVKDGHLVFTDGGMITGDVIIGADGVWSNVRRSIQQEVAAFSGRIAWRTTIPIENTPKGISKETVGLWLGPDGHVLSYPIEAGRTLNIVAIQQGEWLTKSWSVPGEKGELADYFAGWAQPVQELLTLPADWLKWALCAVSPRNAWQNGQVALLGDAAHAMLPFMAQGAVMSLEDAVVLAHQLKDATCDTVPLALQEYEQQRKQRVAKVWDLSVQQGRIYHMSGPMRLARNAVMGTMGGLIAKRYDWLYDWTPPS